MCMAKAAILNFKGCPLVDWHLSAPFWITNFQHFMKYFSRLLNFLNSVV